MCDNYFFLKEEFYSGKNSTKKYSVGIIDMIKLRNIYNTYTYIPIYIQLNTHIYMQIKKHKQYKKLRFSKKKIYIYKEKKYVQYDSCKSTRHTLDAVQLI